MSTRARVQSREVRRAREIAAAESARRRRVLTGGGLVIVGLVAAIVISVVVAATRSGTPQSTASSPGPVVTPTAATATGALTAGSASAPVRLEVYLDYMCPYCGRFERANGAELQRLVGDGTVRLELYPLAILDRMSQGSRYSTRTANAVATVADRAPDKLLAFNQALFAGQPEENTRGLSDDQIATTATGAGVPADVVSLFAARTFESWVTSATQGALSSGVTGTPTVKINGVLFKGDLYSVGPLTAAITAAKVS